MELKTKKYYIAYLDILGYKNILKNNPQESIAFLNKILDAVERLKKSISYYRAIAKQFFGVEVALELRVFSDNILLCLPVKQEENEIVRGIVFLLSAALIQRGLVLEHELIVRGGITIGDFFINKDIVFGEGLIDAVLMESKAEYPYVVVSEELKKHLSKMLHDVSCPYQKLKEIVQKKNQGGVISAAEEDFLSKNRETVAKEVFYSRSLQELMCHFPDEPAFINYLFDLSFRHVFGYEFAEYIDGCAAKEPNKYKGIVEVQEDYFGFIQVHKMLLMRGLKKYCNYDDISITDSALVLEREKIARKWIWLLRYHNSVCEERDYKMGLFPHRLGYDPHTLRLIVRVE